MRHGKVESFGKLMAWFGGYKARDIRVNAVPVHTVRQGNADSGD